MAFLFFSNLIPKKAIYGNLSESVEYLGKLSGNIYRYKLIEENYSTTVDSYADYMSMRMLYYLDESKPIKSILEARTFMEDTNFGFKPQINKQIIGRSQSKENKVVIGKTRLQINKQIVEGKLTSNYSYYRYWHGNLGILKILFAFFNYKQIFILFKLLVYLLLGVIGYLLIKRKKYSFLIFFILSYIATYSYVAFHCFEYIWMYLLAFVFCILGVFVYDKKESFIISMFVICGVVTNFLDFLTIETFPCLLFLVTILVFRYDNKDSLKKMFIFSFKCLLTFFLSYCFMWCFKWIISSFVFRVDFVDLVKNHILERMTGSDTVNYLNHLWSNVMFVNINALFPLNYFESKALVLSLSILSILLLILKIILKKMRNIDYILLLVLIVPYLRYSIMLGHSYIHYFFTFRAQFISVLCFLFIIFDRNIFNNKKV